MSLPKIEGIGGNLGVTERSENELFFSKAWTGKYWDRVTKQTFIFHEITQLFLDVIFIRMVRFDNKI